MVHGGEIDAIALKDTLVPKYISAGEWADWWSKARTAAKRSPNLALTGRSPVVVKYHPQGLTLEQEMAPIAQAARTPLDHLAVLQLYVREARSRKTRPQAEFTGPILRAVAEQAAAFQKQRPADSLAAALAVSAAEAMGLRKPDLPLPSPQEILAGAANPAAVVAELAGAPVWPEALAALAAAPEAARRLEELLRLVPTSELDDVAARLTEAGAAEAAVRAAAEAAAAPLANLELFLWLWKGPSRPLAGIPSKVDLLGRLLKAMQEAESDWQIAQPQRKAILQRCRAALGASDRAAYRQAVSEMDEAVAGTVKRLIERTTGLAAALYEDLLAILRESFFRLFAKEKIAAWLDEGTIWTTEAALHRKQDELKELQEVKMLENARAIGAAAEHGDLSENSEWKFALEERDLLRARAAKMVDELNRARAIRHENVPTDSVGVGSKVTLQRLADGTELELSFLGPWDSNPDGGVFSYQTALALELMGKAVGETVNLKLDGKDGEYRIERLASAV
jgi:transcription elongation GreA/GreB family factor